MRSVHSYAFAVLRQAAARAGDPPPRLVTGAEQDGIIRELLAGDLADGPQSASGWPAHLRPALSTAGFATELRDLLARCAERGVDPLRLQRIGRPSGRPEWVAAGRFAQQYEQVMLLRAAVGTAAPQATVPALGPPNSSAPRSRRSARTPTCWPPSGPGSGCCWSTTRTTSTRRPPGWCGCWPPAPTSRCWRVTRIQAVYGFRGADPRCCWPRTRRRSPDPLAPLCARGGPGDQRRRRGSAGRPGGAASTGTPTPTARSACGWRPPNTRRRR